jgi:hypothetical protein
MGRLKQRPQVGQFARLIFVLNEPIKFQAIASDGRSQILPSAQFVSNWQCLIRQHPQLSPALCSRVV